MRKMRKLLKYAVIISLLSSVLATQGCGNTTVTETSVVEETVSTISTVTEREPEVSVSVPVETEPVEEIEENEETETSTSVEEEPVIEAKPTEEVEEVIPEEPETEVVEEPVIEEKEPELTYEPYEVTLYCHKEVNVRKTPSSKGKKVGSIKVGEEVKVIGKDKETGWYLLENGYYCSSDKSYLKKDKYVAPKKEETPVVTEPVKEPTTTPPVEEPKKEEPKSCTHNKTREEAGEKKWENVNGTRCTVEYQWYNTVCADCGVVLSSRKGEMTRENHCMESGRTYVSGSADSSCGEHVVSYDWEKCQCGMCPEKTYNHFNKVLEHGYWIGQEFTKQEGYDRVWCRPYTCINCGDYYEEETSRDIDFYKPAEPTE